MKVAYVRVSSKEQNEQRQVEALEKHGIEKWFVEKISGRTNDRPELNKMLEFVREGDEIFIMDLSRISRSLKGLIEIVETLQEKKVSLHSEKENIDTSTATGRMMVSMFGVINQFYIDNQREAQLEGIAIAKERGVYTGRKPKMIVKDVWEESYNAYSARKISKAKFAEQIGVSRPTLDKMLHHFKDGDTAFLK